MNQNDEIFSKSFFEDKTIKLLLVFIPKSKSQLLKICLKNLEINVVFERLGDDFAVKIVPTKDIKTYNPTTTAINK